MKLDVKSSVKLWEYITEGRNYDEKGYDLEASNIIKTKLDLPLDKKILVGLKLKEKKSEPIELEVFIRVFFESTQPFSDMMVDLLKMFEEISVKQTDKNLDIEFDFDKGKLPTTVNLEQFKSYTASMVEIDKEYDIPDLDDNQLWDLLNILKQSDTINGIPSDIKSWLAVYENDKEWISDFPKLDISHDSPLYIVFLIWKRIANELKGYKSKAEFLENNQHIYFSLVSNRWFDSVLKCLVHLEQNESSETTKKLTIFFSEVKVKKIMLKEKIEKLDEFLKLPFWDKRYELYSVWIFSLIYRATKDYNLTVHTVDNKLIFPFKETHLATIKCPKGNILIYSEKKTKLENPVGKFRTRHIQPDYSFFKEPVTHSRSSILEIECKQYKKQSTKNFACALVDYANGRKNADVLLVNYGDVKKENIFKYEVEKGKTINSMTDLKKRCDTIGTLKPKNNENILIEKIQQKLDAYACKPFMFEEPFKVTLYWKKPLQDLDLYLDFKDEDAIKKVSYQNKEIGFMFLNKDVQFGSLEAEIISVNKVQSGIYKFYVKNYSNNYFDENVICEIFINDKIIQKIKPTNYNGEYWDLFKIDTIKKTFNLINNVYRKKDENCLK